MLNKDQLSFLKFHYPNKGKMWCAKQLKTTEGSIRSYASKLGLRLNKNSEFYKESQKRGGLAKVGKKRPGHSRLMKEKFKNGELSFPERTKHNLSRTKSYIIWSSMIARCYKKNNSSYVSYGARGISVCKEWHDIRVFSKWFHENYREGLTIERMDYNGNYEPSNCTFATVSEQARNKRTTKLNKDKVKLIRNMYHNNISQVKIAEIIGISNQTVSSVVNHQTWKNI